MTWLSITTQLCPRRPCETSWHACEWVMAHTWMSHVTHVNDLWHASLSLYNHVLDNPLKRHGTHMNEPWHMYEWVMAHTWMSHGTHMNESWHIYEWVMSHTWMTYDMPLYHHTFMPSTPPVKRHGTRVNESWQYMNEPWHIYEWVMAHIWMSHVTHVKDL